jgi:hypothetical protein
VTTPPTALRALFQVIEDEAARNRDFSDRLAAALRGLVADVSADGAPLPVREPPPARPARAKSRRAPAAFDPVALARQGEEVLREGLSGLTIEQLKDIIAGHGMDPGKLTTRWRTESKLIGHITTLALSRSRKGEAFL